MDYLSTPELSFHCAQLQAECRLLEAPAVSGAVRAAGVGLAEMSNNQCARTILPECQLPAPCA